MKAYPQIDALLDQTEMRNDAHTAVTFSSRRDYIADTAREIWRAHTQGYSPVPNIGIS